MDVGLQVGPGTGITGQVERAVDQLDLAGTAQLRQAGHAQAATVDVGVVADGIGCRAGTSVGQNEFPAAALVELVRVQPAPDHNLDAVLHTQGGARELHLSAEDERVAGGA